MGTLRVERIYMVVTIVAWLTISEKQFLENKINFAIALLAAAMVISAVMSPYPEAWEPMVNWLKYVVFYVLVMTSVKTEKELKILMTGLMTCFFLYLVHSYREYLNGRYDWAMGTKRMIGVDSTMSNPNGFGASIVIMLPVLLPFLALIRKKRWYLFILAYFLLSVRCVQLTGSRSSLITLLLCLVLAAVVARRRYIYIPAMLGGVSILWLTMTDNLRDRYLSLFDSSINESANESAEGRWFGFIEGLQNWETSPIWGVGPDCHGLATGGGFLSHCLYGQIPGELGSLGVAAFVLLLFCYIVNHISVMLNYGYMKRLGMEKEALYCYRVSLGMVCGVGLMLFFGLSGHNGYRYTWVWFAAFQAVACSILQEKVEKIRKRLIQGLPPVPPEHESTEVVPSGRGRQAAQKIVF